MRRDYGIEIDPLHCDVIIGQNTDQRDMTADADRLSKRGRTDLHDIVGVWLFGQIQDGAAPVSITTVVKKMIGAHRSARGRWKIRFASGFLAPVIESFLRQAVKLTILPLVQVATLRPHGALARKPRPDVSKLHSRSPSRSPHLQNREQKQIVGVITLTSVQEFNAYPTVQVRSPASRFPFPVLRTNFPDKICREFF